MGNQEGTFPSYKNQKKIKYFSLFLCWIKAF